MNWQMCLMNKANVSQLNFNKMHNELLNCIIPILKVFTDFEENKGEATTILLAEIPKAQIFLLSK